MKVQNPNLTALTADVSTASRTSRAAAAGLGAPGSTASQGAGDDVHLSELVRSLRSLAADSPDRQAKIEQLARSYANGTYQTDAGATAAAIIQDAIKI